MDDERPGGLFLRMAVVAAVTTAAALRVFGEALFFLPRWFALIVLVFGALGLLSVVWTLVRSERWGEKNAFDYIADAMLWLPWG
jgi:hypothetical protein